LIGCGGSGVFGGFGHGGSGLFCGLGCSGGGIFGGGGGISGRFFLGGLGCSGGGLGSRCGFLRGTLGRNLAELIIRANRDDGGDDGKPELVHMWFPPFPRDCSLRRIWHFRRNFERLDSEAAPIRKAG
jgi:hypothetical protein